MIVARPQVEVLDGGGDGIQNHIAHCEGIKLTWGVLPALSEMVLPAPKDQSCHCEVAVSAH